MALRLTEEDYNPLHMVAVEGNGSTPTVELYAFSGNSPKYLFMTHVFRGQKSTRYVTCGLEKFAQNVEAFARAGFTPVLNGPSQAMQLSINKAKSLGENLISYRPLNEEELTEIQKYRKILPNNSIRLAA